MRLCLLLALFPCFLTAQNKDSLTENIFQRVRLQAGILLQFDGKTSETYSTVDFDLVPYYPRRLFVSSTVSWAPIRANQGLRIQMRLGYDHFKFFGNNLVIGHTNFGEGFKEKVNYKHLQTALGLVAEFLPNKPISPYLSGHFLLSVPLSLRYEATRAVSSDLPTYVEINGGGKLSSGWEAGLGLRLKFDDSWLATFGVYRTKQNISTDWPSITGRNFRTNAILRTNAFGLLLSWQYQL